MGLLFFRVSVKTGENTFFFSTRAKQLLQSSTCLFIRKTWAKRIIHAIEHNTTLNKTF